MSTSEETWLRLQEKVFTRCINSLLSNKNLQLEQGQLLKGGLDDGIVLYTLLETLTKKSIPALNRKAKFQIQRIANMNIVLNFLKQDGLKNMSIVAEDIVNRNPKLILGFIWSILLHYQILKNGIGNNKGSGDIIEWLTNIGLSVTNVTTDFLDGSKICQLLQIISPGSIDIGLISEPLAMTEKAIRVAETVLGVPPLIDAADLCTTPDQRANLIYLSFYRDKWNDKMMSAPVTPIKLDRNHDTSFHEGYIPQESALPDQKIYSDSIQYDDEKADSNEDLNRNTSIMKPDGTLKISRSKFRKKPAVRIKNISERNGDVIWNIQCDNITNAEDIVILVLSEVGDLVSDGIRIINKEGNIELSFTPIPDIESNFNVFFTLHDVEMMGSPICVVVPPAVERTSVFDTPPVQSKEAIEEVSRSNSSSDSPEQKKSSDNIKTNEISLEDSSIAPGVDEDLTHTEKKIIKNSYLDIAVTMKSTDKLPIDKEQVEVKEIRIDKADLGLTSNKKLESIDISIEKDQKVYLNQKNEESVGKITDKMEKNLDKIQNAQQKPIIPQDTPEPNQVNTNTHNIESINKPSPFSIANSPNEQPKTVFTTKEPELQILSPVTDTLATLSSLHELINNPVSDIMRSVKQSLDNPNSFIDDNNSDIKTVSKNHTSKETKEMNESENPKATSRNSTNTVKAQSSLDDTTESDNSSTQSPQRQKLLPSKHSTAERKKITKRKKLEQKTPREPSPDVYSELFNVLERSIERKIHKQSKNDGIIENYIDSLESLSPHDHILQNSDAKKNNRSSLKDISPEQRRSKKLIKQKESSRPRTPERRVKSRRVAMSQPYDDTTPIRNASLGILPSNNNTPKFHLPLSNDGIVEKKGAGTSSSINSPLSNCINSPESSKSSRGRKTTENSPRGTTHLLEMNSARSSKQMVKIQSEKKISAKKVPKIDFEKLNERNKATRSGSVDNHYRTPPKKDLSTKSDKSPRSPKIQLLPSQTRSTPMVNQRNSDKMEPVLLDSSKRTKVKASKTLENSPQPVLEATKSTPTKRRRRNNSPWNFSFRRERVLEKSLTERRTESHIDPKLYATTDRRVTIGKSNNALEDSINYDDLTSSQKTPRKRSKSHFQSIVAPLGLHRQSSAKKQPSHPLRRSKSERLLPKKEPKLQFTDDAEGSSSGSQSTHKSKIARKKDKDTSEISSSFGKEAPLLSKSSDQTDGVINRRSSSVDTTPELRHSKRGKEPKGRIIKTTRKKTKDHRNKIQHRSKSVASKDEATVKFQTKLNEEKTPGSESNRSPYSEPSSIRRSQTEIKTPRVAFEETATEITSPNTKPISITFVEVPSRYEFADLSFKITKNAFNSDTIGRFYRTPDGTLGLYFYPTEPGLYSIQIFHKSSRRPLSKISSHDITEIEPLKNSDRLSMANQSPFKEDNPEKPTINEDRKSLGFKEKHLSKEKELITASYYNGMVTISESNFYDSDRLYIKGINAEISSPLKPSTGNFQVSDLSLGPGQYEFEVFQKDIAHAISFPFSIIIPSKQSPEKNNNHTDNDHVPISPRELKGKLSSGETNVEEKSIQTENIKEPDPLNGYTRRPRPVRKRTVSILGRKQCFHASTLTDKQGKPLSQYDISTLIVKLSREVDGYVYTGSLKFLENELVLEFVPSTPGIYKAEIYSGSTMILPQPVGLPVLNKPVLPQIIEFDGPIEVGSSGLDLVLETITDAYGAQLLFDKNEIKIEVNGPDPAVTRSCFKNSDGLYQLSFQPKKPGFYRAQAYLWDHPLFTRDIEFLVKLIPNKTNSKSTNHTITTNFGIIFSCKDGKLGVTTDSSINRHNLVTNLSQSLRSVIETKVFDSAVICNPYPSPTNFNDSVLIFTSLIKTLLSTDLMNESGSEDFNDSSKETLTLTSQIYLYLVCVLKCFISEKDISTFTILTEEFLINLLVLIQRRLDEQAIEEEVAAFSVHFKNLRRSVHLYP